MGDLISKSVDKSLVLWLNIVTRWPGAPLTRSVSFLTQETFPSSETIEFSPLPDKIKEISIEVIRRGNHARKNPSRNS
jgi:hypothetical protein